MIDHASIPVRDLAASAAFYDRVLQPLGMRRIADRPHTIGYGKRYPEFWLNARPGLDAVPDDTGSHVAIRAASEDIVAEFHRIALARGGRCDGPPGPRQGEMTAYYGAFIRDPDGNKIEVLTFPRDDA